MKYCVQKINKLIDVKLYRYGNEYNIDKKTVYGSNNFGYTDEVTLLKECENYYTYIVTSPRDNFVSVIKFLLNDKKEIDKAILLNKIYFENGSAPHHTFVGENCIFFCLNDSSQIVIAKKNNLQLCKIYSSDIPLSFHESSTLNDKIIFITVANGDIYQLDWEKSKLLQKTENKSGAITYRSSNYLWFNCANSDTSLIGSKSSGIHRVDRNNNVEYFPSFPNNLNLEILGCQCPRPVNDSLIFVSFISGPYFGYYNFTSEKQYQVRLFNLKVANLQFIEIKYNPINKVLYLISTSLLSPASIDALVKIPNFDKIMENENINEISNYEIYKFNAGVSTHRLNTTPNENNILVTLSGRGTLFISQK